MAERISGSRSSLRSRTVQLVEIAVLVAIIIIMAFTPLGYLKIGVVSITFITIPVVVGAIHLGPGAGAFLGGVFGATSLIQCFGMDFFGTTIFSISPIGTIVLTLVPRILMGFLVGLIFRALENIDRTEIISFGVASLSGALLNTALFIGGFFLIFLPFANEISESFGSSLVVLVGSMLTINALIEAAVCLVVGGAISKALSKFFASRHNI